ncbi:complement C1q-like protein 4 [Saccostrea echinata]|uniref:complement C1q-like protein 4 n=1 Tax=Saccostrea echinata TaxID=191078 RepID=UPI002A828587|nr:complement C1q-like protein 4 [Saccostrea echinata]
MSKKFIKKQLTALADSVNMIIEGPNSFPVAFHAEMGPRKTIDRGQTWIYDKVITNEGNGYNSATGKFIAPAKGLYLFAWSSLSDPGKQSHAGLIVNGKMMGRQSLNNIHGGSKWITAGNTIILVLQKGDNVYIKDVHGRVAELNGPWTTFSGVQLG